MYRSVYKLFKYRVKCKFDNDNVYFQYGPKLRSLYLLCHDDDV